MPELMETADELGPEKILHVYDPAAGMKAVELLFQRGIHFIPDFISNAGAVMSGPVAQVGGTLDDLFRVLTEVLGQSTRDMFTEARKEGVSARSLAVRRYTEKVLKARTEKGAALSNEQRIRLYRQRFKI